jgi:hypothetical protein
MLEQYEPRLLLAGHAPSGADFTVTTPEDSTYTFASLDFRMTDPDDQPPDSPKSIIITALPNAGTLAFNHVPVIVAQEIPVLGAIDAAMLTFTPASNASGAPYATFAFQVKDDGGTANEGADVDPTPNTATINVTPVNDAPSGSGGTYYLAPLCNNITQYVLKASDFGFTDPNDSPPNGLLAVKLMLSGAGSLTDDGIPVAANQIIPVSDLSAGRLVYTVSGSAANGSPLATLTFQVQDDGGTANGGLDISPTPSTISFLLAKIMAPPIVLDRTLNVLEDVPYVLDTHWFPYSEVMGVDLTALKVTTLPTKGWLTDNGLNVAAGQIISAADIAAGNFRYLPGPTNAVGTPLTNFTYQGQVAGNAFCDGSNLDPTPRTLTINVIGISDAPIGQDHPVVAVEDTSYGFRTSDFPFTDPGDTPADPLRSVTIVSLPVLGSLALRNGSFVDLPVSAGQVIQATDIAASKLKFLAAPNAYGTPYTSFTFKIQDNGGTGFGGADIDNTPHTQTISVLWVNDMPSGTDRQVTTAEDIPFSFSASDFPINDSADFPANALKSVKITSLPATGQLQLAGVPVQLTDPPIQAANLTALRFVPGTDRNDLNTPKPFFSFQLQDAGGTNVVTGGDGSSAIGVDTDSTPNTITISVASVPDAPLGSNNTISGLEDTDYVFKSVDFLFSDPNDSPPDAFALLLINSLPDPSTGILMLNVNPVTFGQQIPVASIVAGQLRFRPAANGNGTAFSTFTFRVRDTGDTSNGGANLEPAANAHTITINVTPINDPPVGQNSTVQIFSCPSSTTYTFSVFDFAFTDSNDSPPNAMAAVIIESPPTIGTLTYGGAPVTAQMTPLVIPASNLATLQFTEPAMKNPPVATFTFQVKDFGGTANGGVDTDPIPKTISIIGVSGPNLRPSSGDAVINAVEDVPYQFGPSDFPIDTLYTNLVAVKIETLPSAGVLNDNNVPVVLGQIVPVADLSSKLLVYTPPANANGITLTSFAYSYRDDGGLCWSPVDFEYRQTLTINVASVNDPPSGADKTLTTWKDTPYRFLPIDFGFTDANDNPSNNFLAVTITTIPAAGSLQLGNNPVVAGQSISVSQISSLAFTPSPGAIASPYATFSFQVQDNGGTANGGSDVDPTSNTFTINVVGPWHNPQNPFDIDGDGQVPAQDALILSNYLNATGPGPVPANAKIGPPFYDVNNDQLVTNDDLALLLNYLSPGNDPPRSADQTITVFPNEFYVFSTDDFAFTDFGDVPPNNLKAIQIVTPPNGEFRLGVEPVLAGQFIAVQDLVAGRLAFFTNEPGDADAPFTSFTFKVQDDGGTASGNGDLASAENTITINVPPLNQPPVFQAGPEVEVFDDAGPISIAGWVTAISAGPPNEASQKVHFQVNNNSPSLFAVQPAVDSSGKLTFQPALGASGIAGIAIVAVDDGGTAHGGVDTSESQLFTIGVAPHKPLHNRIIPADVSGDGQVVAEDALDVINFISAFGSGPVPKSEPGEGPPLFYYDVTGDDYIAADDIIAIINYINAHPIVNPEATQLAVGSPAAGNSAADATSSDALYLLLAIDSAQQAQRRKA